MIRKIVLNYDGLITVDRVGRGIVALWDPNNTMVYVLTSNAEDAEGQSVWAFNGLVPGYRAGSLCKVHNLISTRENEIRCHIDSGEDVFFFETIKDFGMWIQRLVVE